MLGFSKHCPVCGIDVKNSSIKRFGKYLCSEEHAQQYVEKKTEEEKMAEERRTSRDRGGGCC